MNETVMRNLFDFLPDICFDEIPLSGGALQYANGECHQVLRTYMKYLQSEES